MSTEWVTLLVFSEYLLSIQLCKLQITEPLQKAMADIVLYITSLGPLIPSAEASVVQVQAHLEPTESNRDSSCYFCTMEPCYL
jgi:hypothetical protein